LTGWSQTVSIEYKIMEAKSLRIATVQFENRPGDKSYNLSVVEDFSTKATAAGCDIISFHECCITGYTFARDLTEDQLLSIAEPVPTGPSTQELIRIATKAQIVIFAGLFEKDDSGAIYNTYVCVSPDEGLLAKHRKMHPFINKHLSAGNDYTVFALHGWKMGILICYDNNVVENVRATALLGAEIVFMPHVTMCTPSTRPGAGFVSPKLWYRREEDPTSLRAEFVGLKGRAWLMKWLPARAYDNAVYAVFSNTIGMDGDQLKNGCSMILDPFGDILAECTRLGDEMVSTLCTREKLQLAGGYRYRQARRPELYGNVIGMEHGSQLRVDWLNQLKDD
jgi:beta-ureidopropionase